MTRGQNQPFWLGAGSPIRHALVVGWLGMFSFAAFAGPNRGENNPGAAKFHKEVAPILARYCSDCHEDGMHKGNVAFDELGSDEALLANQALWLKVLKNVRAGLMPPEKKDRPDAQE